MVGICETVLMIADRCVQGLYDAAARPPPTRPIRPRPVRRSVNSLASALADLSLADAGSVAAQEGEGMDMD